MGYLGGGLWSFDIIYILPSFQSAVGSLQTNNENLPDSLVIGPGRNDGVNRIYICPYNSDSLYEFTYSNGDWVKKSEKLLEAPTTVFLLKITQGRNDDTFRVYGCPLDPDTLREFTWRNGVWDIHRIPFLGYHSFAIGKGRNDDTMRLYIKGWPSPKELTYRGGWDMDTMLSVPPVENLLMAEGHNDGLNRLYGQYYRGDLTDTLTLYEITYQNGKWEVEKIDETIPEYPLGIHLKTAGSARNDDTFRLYGCNTEKNWEYTYRGSWIKEEIGSPPGYLEIGRGRGDDTNRIYAYGSSIIEFSYAPRGIGEDKNIPQKVIEQPIIIIPNPVFEKVKIQYTVSDDGPVSLQIYDATGGIVRELARGYKKQGKYNAYWDGKNNNGNEAGNGVFFCQLSTGTHTFSKKIIRLK